MRIFTTRTAKLVVAIQYYIEPVCFYTEFLESIFITEHAKSRILVKSYEVWHVCHSDAKGKFHKHTLMGAILLQSKWPSACRITCNEGFRRCLWQMSPSSFVYSYGTVMNKKSVILSHCHNTWIRKRTLLGILE